MNEAEKLSAPYDLATVFSMVERIGDIVFDIFGGYNSMYTTLREQLEAERLDSITRRPRRGRGYPEGRVAEIIWLIKVYRPSTINRAAI